jgi:hypothetical protein
MLRCFYKGALHGLILGALGCGMIAAGLHGPLGSEAGTPDALKASTGTLEHRHAQKVFPMLSATGP